MRNESDSQAWHPMEKGSAETCKRFSSLDPWGIQTNPQVPVSWAVFLQLLLDQLPETRLPACPSPTHLGTEGLSSIVPVSCLSVSSCWMGPCRLTLDSPRFHQYTPGSKEGSGLGGGDWNFVTRKSFLSLRGIRSQRMGTGPVPRASHVGGGSDE